MNNAIIKPTTYRHDHTTQKICLMISRITGYLLLLSKHKYGSIPKEISGPERKTFLKFFVYRFGLGLLHFPRCTVFFWHTHQWLIDDLFVVCHRPKKSS